MSFDSHMIIDEDTNRDNNSIMKYDRRDTYFGSTALYTSSLVKMSFDSHTIIDEDTNRDNNSIMKYDRRDTYFGSTVLYTSSVVINFHQLKTDLYAQHHHEKDALDQLNQRFHRFVDRIQLLQSQNSKYIAAIADLKREFSGSSSIDVQSDEHYLSIKSNLLTLNIGKVDYEFDLEMFQLQIQIYQHLIETEKQGKNQRILKLEEELKQSASVLITLRTSYAELQRQVENHNVENEDLLKEYLKLTHHLCDVKKQRQKSDLNVETWKSYIEFYKNLRSHTEREFNSSSIQSDDVTQFWTLELNNIIKRIRHDFQLYYAIISREMTQYYQTKMEKLETAVKQALYYQQIEMEEFTRIYQTQQIEYEKVQNSLSYEKDILIKLENTYSKLEFEFKSIQIQHKEQFEAQSEDLHNVQESIIIMANHVEQIRISKINLETEIIVYRHLLDNNEVQQPMKILSHTQPIQSQIMGKFIVKKQKKGSIAIKECAPNGTYITLINHSTKKYIDISRWTVTRHIHSKNKFQYTIPDGIRLEPKSELRIYANLDGVNQTESLSNKNLVNKDLRSWGTGNKIETLLFDQKGNKTASYLQSISF